jgi:lipopolysaccharide/colanic/teichoic acid biosynthesis glycosyltransferase
LPIEKFSPDVLHPTVAVKASQYAVIHPSLSFRFFKRSIDILISVMLLPVLVLLYLFLFIVNRFLNPGEVLFTQERVGKDGVRFNIYKFRSMVGKNSDPRFATQETKRINRLGAFMRDCRIDEVPQIINVLKGEMSIIGPRPEQVSFYKKYEKGINGYGRRQRVLPGITGLAQLKYGYTADEAGTARKLKWDLEYINRQNMRLEIYIMRNTMYFVVGRLLSRRTKTRL